eukprot:10012754-Alexandrium_andersonii.AAC.1
MPRASRTASRPDVANATGARTPNCAATGARAPSRPGPPPARRGAWAGGGPRATVWLVGSAGRMR